MRIIDVSRKRINSLFPQEATTYVLTIGSSVLTINSNVLTLGGDLTPPTEPPLNQQFVYFGSATQIPINQTELEALAQLSFVGSNAYDLRTGTDNTLFVFALPESVNNNPVIEIQDIKYNIVLDYSYDGLISVTYNNDFVINYRVYIYRIDNPYPLSSTHRLIL
jgi:hypothetical protein